MTIHARIKDLRIQSGKSQEEFAVSINLKRGNLSQIELGKQLPTLDTIREIARIYGKSYQWIIDGNENSASYGEHKPAVPVLNEPKVSYIPQVVTVTPDDDDIISIVGQKAAAGYLNGYSDPEFIERLPTISAPGYRGALHRAFEIRGNSMPPLHTGSISIGRYVESLTDIKNRRVYIILSKLDGVVIKRVINVPEEQKLILISDNPNKREFGNYTIDYEDILEVWYWRGGLIRELPDPSDLYNRMNDYEARLTILEERQLQMIGKGKQKG
ncbi:XRE family transcriptional regulator [Mucilaginibacter ximonensis]|uniref:XRE family transcriptional regulator n=1 Tax=Mucilaginibacter ximonensis TaxID=538021 RepID=A0ABW5YFD8_9SPHI